MTKGDFGETKLPTPRYRVRPVTEILKRLSERNLMTNEAELRPTIGVIASRYARAGGNTMLSGIGEQYLLAVEAGGGIPLLIHLTHDAAVIQAHYQRCDGL